MFSSWLIISGLQWLGWWNFLMWWLIHLVLVKQQSSHLVLDYETCVLIVYSHPVLINFPQEKTHGFRPGIPPISINPLRSPGRFFFSTPVLLRSGSFSSNSWSEWLRWVPTCSNHLLKIAITHITYWVKLGKITKIYHNWSWFIYVPQI